MSLDPRLAMIPATQDPQTALAARVSDLERRLRATGTEGDDDWTLVSSFQNGWANMVASAYVDARFRRIASGLVLLEGTIQGGTNGTTAFVLPAGYRPSDEFWIVSHGWTGSAVTLARARIYPDGSVAMTLDATPTAEAHFRATFRAAS